MFRSTATIAILAGAAEATFRYGSCPEFQVMESFDVNRYVGRWYEIVRDQLTLFQLV